MPVVDTMLYCKCKSLDWKNGYIKIILHSGSSIFEPITAPPHGILSD